MRRGKILFFLVVAIFVLLDVTMLINYLMRDNPGRVLSTSVRLLILLALFFCAYRGHNWARVILLVLISAGTIFVFALAASTGAVILWIGTLLFAFAAYALGLSVSVRTFLNRGKVVISREDRVV